MKKTRPINLNLFSMRFPITAITSILHRISGFILFLIIPLLLWIFQASMRSEISYQKLHTLLTSAFSKIIILACVAAFVYHIFAGIRHLFMDLGFGEDLNVAKAGSWTVLVLTAITMILMGVWIW